MSPGGLSGISFAAARSVTLIATSAFSSTIFELPVTVAVYVPRLVPASVLMVSFEVTGRVPVIAAGCVVEQVGASTAPAGFAVTEHFSVTLPVKPPFGVTVMVAVALFPGAGMLIGVVLSVNVGWVTVILTVVFSTTLPRLPVNVAV